MQYLKDIYKKSKFFRWITLPIILFGWGVFSSGIYYLHSDISPTVVSIRHFQGDEEVKTETITDGNRLESSFTAKDNYLGIISLYFKKNKPLLGRVIFTMKESSSDTWQIKNEYDAREFYYLSEYPFGFPVIEDSKGKKYDYRIEYHTLTSSSGILELEKPFIITKYKYQLSHLTSDVKTLLNFLISKFKYSLFIERQFKHLVLYFSPFVFIISLNALEVFLPLLNKKLEKQVILIWVSKNKYFLRCREICRTFLPKPYVLFALYIVMEAMLFLKVNTFHIIVIVIIWSVYLFKNKLGSGTTFLHSAILVIPLIFLLIFDFAHITEKLTVYIFIFLSIALMQSIYEFRKNVYANEK